MKTGKIPSDWSDIAKGRLRERIYQYRKDKTSINTNTVDDDPMVRTNGKKRKRTEEDKVCTLLTMNWQPDVDMDQSDSDNEPTTHPIPSYLFYLKLLKTCKYRKNC